MSQTATIGSLKAQAERHEAIACAARERAARSLHGLCALLDQRPELRGVHGPADLAAEAIRWSA